MSTETVNTMTLNQAGSEPKKYATSVADSSRSLSQKARHTSPDEAKQKNGVPETRAPSQRTSMPKLQTHDAHIQPVTRAPTGASPTLVSPGGLSFIPDDDEENEIITGPSPEDDELAAPAPTVRHGKQQDVVSRQRKRSSIASFTSAKRGTSPETLRNIAPLVRTYPESYSNPASFEPHHPHQLQQELLPDDIEEEPRKPKSISPPESYVPTGAPSGVASVRTSRSSSPIKLHSRQRSSSRLSALAALEGQSQISSSPPRRSTRGGRSRRSSVQSGLGPRQSQYSMSSMSNALSQLYTTHEREFKDRQSVHQEDLLARGLENMDFSALR